MTVSRALARRGCILLGWSGVDHDTTFEIPETTLIWRGKIMAERYRPGKASEEGVRVVVQDHNFPQLLHSTCATALLCMTR